MRNIIKRGRRAVPMLLLILALMFTTACQSVTEDEANESVPREAAAIGMCFDTFTIERWLKDRDVFTFTAAELGQSVEVLNANGDVKKQREQLEHLMEIGVKAIVIIAVDADQITDLVDKAHDQGIKVIAYDRLIENADIDMYISFDNRKVGEEMAEAMATQFERNSITRRNVLMLEGPASDKNVEMVHEGFMSVADENAFHVVESTHIDGWRADYVGSFLAENEALLETIDAIMCGNDSLAAEAIRFLSEHRMAGKVIVTGQDADLDACQRIVEGTQDATIYKPVEQMAKLTAEYTVDMITRRDFDTSNMEHIENGKLTVPYVGFVPVSVDAENMDQVIIESGFHLREDVYRNVLE